MSPLDARKLVHALIYARYWQPGPLSPAEHAAEALRFADRAVENYEPPGEATDEVQPTPPL